MSNKLYPPIIEGTIPSFYGTKLKVPFQMNRAVGFNEFNRISLVIKSVNTNKVIKSDILSQETYKELSKKQVATFNVSNLNLSIGSFYKIQIAYQSTIGEIGYYSTVAVVKYTDVPQVSIMETAMNQTFCGIYINEDITEKVYSYRFKIFNDSNSSIFADSGDILHNSSTDIPGEGQKDFYTVEKEFKEGQIYRIQYSVITVNKMVVESDSIQIYKASLLPPTEEIKFETIVNRNKGCVSFRLIGEKDKAYTGTYSIVRSNEKSEFAVWEQVYLFRLNSVIPSTKIFYEDYTVEQGVKYKYAFQQVNLNGDIYSERFSTSNEVVIPQFEDMFLLDGERQLKIRFNPKISSFKKNIQEQKTETIGNKYPYIMRNGSVEYISFQIQGLISTEIDDENTFLKAEREEYFRDTTPSNKIFETGLYSDIQVKKERDFRTEVFNWLTNGKPKLFKSSTEGNYIVRLMNISLTPKEELSRILYEFSCEAYEIAEINYEFYKENGFIVIPEPEELTYMWKTIELTGNDSFEGDIYSISAVDMVEQDQLILDSKTIVIGAIGQYSVDLYQNPIKKISWVLNTKVDATTLRPRLLTICYKEAINTTEKSFDNVKTFKSEVIVEQYTDPVNISKGNEISEFYSLTFLLTGETGYVIFTHNDDTNITVNLTETKQYQLQYPKFLKSFETSEGIETNIVAQKNTVEYQVLTSSDGYTLKDFNGLYLTLKEDENNG